MVHDSQETLTPIPASTRTLRSETRRAKPQESTSLTAPLPATQMGEHFPPAVPRKGKKGKEVRKTAGQVHRMLASELPDDAGGLQV
jgi:hypothetical protein